MDVNINRAGKIVPPSMEGLVVVLHHSNGSEPVFILIQILGQGGDDSSHMARAHDDSRYEVRAGRRIQHPFHHELLRAVTHQHHVAVAPPGHFITGSDLNLGRIRGRLFVCHGFSSLRYRDGNLGKTTCCKMLSSKFIVQRGHCSTFPAEKTMIYPNIALHFVFR
jgi:hypothetical protein